MRKVKMRIHENSLSSPLIVPMCIDVYLTSRLQLTFLLLIP